MSESNSSMQKYTRGQCVKNLYRIVQDFETAADDEIVQWEQVFEWSSSLREGRKGFIGDQKFR